MPAAITSKPRNSYVLKSVRDQMVDAVGGTEVELELDDGTIVHFQHPLFRDKDLKAELKRYTKQDAADQDEDEFAMIILGDDYDAFVEHGGDPDDLQLVLLKIQRDTTDSLSGKRPTSR